MGIRGARSLNERDPQQVGPYRIIAVLGVGGMGTVYLGHEGGETAAVKTIHPHLAADDEFVARFRREADAARLVQSVCCARFLNADPEATTPWLAMEYVPGPSLNQAVEHRGPMEGDQLIAFAVGLAEAVTALHEVGIVHRDIKPSNVLLAKAGPRVIDFGIARLQDGPDLTRTGQGAGSPGWMAPEQVSGAHVGPEVDVFAWAATVAYAGRGKGPFAAPTPQMMMFRTLEVDPELDGLPDGLRDLCRQALDKDPTKRPPSSVVLGSVLGSRSPSVDVTAVSVPVQALLERSWVVATPPPTAYQDYPPPEVADGAARRRVIEATVLLLLLIVAVALVVMRLLT